mmetsp:Transcript_139926/g.390068  ORF Transcript_139926/g.390068 Transcript_139926/m.390068 type:complete len:295 (-) Transcript_139926:467-1351(-)
MGNLGHVCLQHRVDDLRLLPHRELDVVGCRACSHRACRHWQGRDADSNPGHASCRGGLAGFALCLPRVCGHPARVGHLRPMLLLHCHSWFGLHGRELQDVQSHGSIAGGCVLLFCCRISFHCHDVVPEELHPRYVCVGSWLLVLPRGRATFKPGDPRRSLCAHDLERLRLWGLADHGSGGLHPEADAPNGLLVVRPCGVLGPRSVVRPGGPHWFAHAFCPHWAPLPRRRPLLGGQADVRQPAAAVAGGLHDGHRRGEGDEPNLDGAGHRRWVCSVVLFGRKGGPPDFLKHPLCR